MLNIATPGKQKTILKRLRMFLETAKTGFVHFLENKKTWTCKSCVQLSPFWLTENLHFLQPIFLLSPRCLNKLDRDFTHFQANHYFKTWIVLLKEGILNPEWVRKMVPLCAKRCSQKLSWSGIIYLIGDGSMFPSICVLVGICTLPVLAPLQGCVSIPKNMFPQLAIIP